MFDKTNGQITEGKYVRGQINSFFLLLILIGGKECTRENNHLNTVLHSFEFFFCEQRVTEQALTIKKLSI